MNTRGANGEISPAKTGNEKPPITLTDIHPRIDEPGSAISNNDYLNTLTEEEKAADSPPAAYLQSLVNNMDYSQVENMLLIHIDHLDGIKSAIEVDEKKYPNTHVGYVRDATNALPLESRLPSNNIQFEKDNLLLRVLGSVRGIDHVLKQNESKSPEFHRARLALQNIYREFLIAVLKSEKADFKKMQEGINTKLITLLHGAKLDNGIKDAKGYSKLLGHYRDMAATLDPAKSLVTITQLKNSDYNITQTEISHPITQKTELQKQQLAIMSKIGPALSKKEKNFQTAKKDAFQEVNAAFADLAAMDNRRFAAQTRKYIGPGLKNAYVVHNKLEVKNTANQLVHQAEYTSLRTGSLAYIGFDDKKANIAEYAKENLQQLKNAVPGKKLHFSMLLTALRKDETLIIKTTKKACKDSNDLFSYLPINGPGLMYTPEVSLGIVPADKKDLITKIQTWDVISGKTSRIAKVGEVINLAINTPNVINVTTCASGQDRTGTAFLIGLIKWVSDELARKKIPVDEKQITEMTALGRNSAFIASFATPGSYGMKSNSKQGNFEKAIENLLYPNTAKTNKNPPVNEKQLSQTRKDWQPIKTYQTEPAASTLQQSFREANNLITGAKNSEDIINGLKIWIKTALEQPTAPAARGMFSSVTTLFNSCMPRQTENIKQQLNTLLSRFTEDAKDSSNLRGTVVTLATEVKLIDRINKTKNKQMTEVFSQLNTLLDNADTKLLALSPNNRKTS